MNEPIPVDDSYLNRVQADIDRRRIRASAAATPSPFEGAPQALRDEVTAAVQGLEWELAALARSLHAHPELGLEEHRSAQEIADLLRRHHIEATKGCYGLETALTARVGNGKGPTVAVLAEYDALPGIGHACGHNIIAAIAAGAFLAMAQVLTAHPGALNGTVQLLGTPAEEGMAGKELMAAEGAFDGIDAAIMVHPFGYDIAEQTWLGRRILKVTFTGRAAHASAQAFMGRNALDAASLAYQGIGLLRQQILPVDRVHAVITDGGTVPNVIADRSAMHLYVRSKYPETLRDLSGRVEDIMRGAALMTGCGLDLTWDPKPAVLPVRTNMALTGRWVDAQVRMGRQPLPFGVVPESLAASTDFGNVSYRVPGIHPFLKIADQSTALHSAQFAAAASSEAAMTGVVDGAVGLACTAIDFLADSDLRQAVRDEFEAAGGAIDVPNYFK